MLKAKLENIPIQRAKKNISKGGLLSELMLSTPLIQQKSKLNSMLFNGSDSENKNNFLLQFKKMELKDSESESIKITKIKTWIDKHSSNIESKEQKRTLNSLKSAIRHWELHQEGFDKIVNLFHEIEGYGEIAQMPLHLG